MFNLLEQYPSGRFANRVCRVVVSGLEVEFTGIDGNVRPPKPEELPPVMLSYGTSISQGAYASRPDLGWNALTARAVGHDFINMGSSGTAYCEPAMADYLAGLEWDLCVLELSVNMGGFSIEQFKERVASLVDKLATSHPEAPIFCISLFPFGTGDLWAGNRITGRRVGERGTLNWLIDPAAHGGHREFDLAMMRLFGGFGPECFEAYDDDYPVAAGWEARVPLHQLVPVAVHAIKFGGGYVAATDRALAQIAVL